MGKEEEAEARKRAFVGYGVDRALMAEAETIAERIDAAFLEVTAGHHRPGARRLFEAAGYDGSLTSYLRKRR